MTEKTLVEHLAVVLADTYVTMLQTQCVHWNIEGSDFFSIHNMTQKQYEEMFEAIDEIAERIRALGYPAPCGIKTYQALATVKEFESNMLNTKTACQHLLDSHQQLRLSLNKALAEAERMQDVVTVDLMTERLSTHEKVIWMLNATASGVV
jgi:starvation-inducible DNA-binding protein